MKKTITYCDTCGVETKIDPFRYIKSKDKTFGVNIKVIGVDISKDYCFDCACKELQNKEALHYFNISDNGTGISRVTPKCQHTLCDNKNINSYSIVTLETKRTFEPFLKFKTFSDTFNKLYPRTTICDVCYNIGRIRSEAYYNKMEKHGV